MMSVGVAKYSSFEEGGRLRLAVMPARCQIALLLSFCSVNNTQHASREP